ncbi:uncharacterized protein E0L32_008480 [Thyridium curvatum]|uniref:MFS maltose permease n=1 Tax=Thyridium curvatum TaxID=1093900 RepID=A0A507AVT5_9PEZI|nr:uncharacterized protein E0L32_008480 [Thyridium curvatum]TPX10594.1 hypothetical protein E0L32_008480 [Thyridium curvatum]
MRPRLTLRRLLQRPVRRWAGSSRRFTQNSPSFSRGRPQLPFLGIPLSTRQQFRYLTTERKQWIRYEVLLSLKYTVYIWAMVSCVTIAAFAVQQEWQEREHPTPPEWSYITRMRMRGAFFELNRKDVSRTDYVQVLQMLLDVLERLENPKIDGADIAESGVGGIVGEEAVRAFPGAKDLSKKSEQWRRGYFETLLAAAQAAEHVEGWVKDRTRGIVFPPEVVIGPSNPRPKPIPPGAKSAPREEDCDPMFPSPAQLYNKLMCTDGLTRRQHLETVLSFASWAAYREMPLASSLYQSALYIALPEEEASKINVEKWVQSLSRSGLTTSPSSNILEALTGYATYTARKGDVSDALPLFITLLKARQSLPDTSPKVLADRALEAGENENLAQKTLHAVKAFVKPPVYPPPPSDGTELPVRDEKERCQEAALHLHIGEIMYTARDSAREEGVAWTREGVDIAEEQLHKLGSATKNITAKTTCRECLATGLENWQTMVARLAKEEQEKKGSAQKSGWFGLWRDGKNEAAEGRWAAEEKVAKDRLRRAQDLLEDPEAPVRGASSILHA